MGDSRFYTPFHIDSSVCHARVWADGLGGQCTNPFKHERVSAGGLVAPGKLCASHLGEWLSEGGFLAHGEVQGHIPEAKLREFRCHELEVKHVAALRERLKDFTYMMRWNPKSVQVESSFRYFVKFLPIYRRLVREKEIIAADARRTLKQPPLQTLQHVLSWVSSRTLVLAVPCVSRSWKSVCQNGTEAMLSFEGWYASEFAGVNLTHSILEKAVLTRFLNVVALNLAYTKIGDDTLLVVGRLCGALKSLDISCNQSVSDLGVACISRGCKSLEVIRVAGCKSITDVGMIELSESCHKVCSISLCNRNQLASTSLARMLQNWVHLQELCVDSRVLSWVAVRNHICNLKELVLRGTQADDILLAKLSQTCHALTALDLEECPAVSDKGLISICKGCPHLTRLYARSLRLTDDAAVSIGQCLHELQFLFLCADVFADFSFTDAGVLAVSRGCQRLLELDVCDHTELSDESCEHIARLSSLRVLDMTGIAITDEGFKKIVVSCADLRSVHICRCRVGDAGLAALAVGCKRLSDLCCSKDHLHGWGVIMLAVYSENLSRCVFQGSSAPKGELAARTKLTEGDVHSLLPMIEIWD